MSVEQIQAYYAGIREVQLLERPYVSISPDGNGEIKVLAHSPNPDNEEEMIPDAYISTRQARVSLLGEFSGDPTGEYYPANVVRGMVGVAEVYKKRIATDILFWGLKTTVAQRMAERAVRKRLGH